MTQTSGSVATGESSLWLGILGAQLTQWLRVRDRERVLSARSFATAEISHASGHRCVGALRFVSIVHGVQTVLNFYDIACADYELRIA